MAAGYLPPLALRCGSRVAQGGVPVPDGRMRAEPWKKRGAPLEGRGGGMGTLLHSASSFDGCILRGWVTPAPRVLLNDSASPGGGGRGIGGGLILPLNVCAFPVCSEWLQVGRRVHTPDRAQKGGVSGVDHDQKCQRVGV